MYINKMYKCFFKVSLQKFYANFDITTEHVAFKYVRVFIIYVFENQTKVDISIIL